MRADVEHAGGWCADPCPGGFRPAASPARRRDEVEKVQEAAIGLDHHGLAGSRRRAERSAYFGRYAHPEPIWMDRTCDRIDPGTDIHSLGPGRGGRRQQRRDRRRWWLRRWPTMKGSDTCTSSTQERPQPATSVLPTPRATSSHISTTTTSCTPAGSRPSPGPSRRGPRPRFSTVPGSSRTTWRMKPQDREIFASMSFDPWDRRRLESSNYVDQNVIAHRAGLPEAHFDEALPMCQDWDLMLRLTARRRPLELPARVPLQHDGAAPWQQSAGSDVRNPQSAGPGSHGRARCTSWLLGASPKSQQSRPHRRRHGFSY